MRALLACLALLSCAKTIEELSPIHCTSDGLCPSPYVCVQNDCLKGISCKPMDAACPADRPRCTLARTADTTFDGQCVPQGGAALPGESCQMLSSTFQVSNVSGAFPWPDQSCAAKGFCYDFSLGAGDVLTTAPGVCRAFCGRDADCPGGQRCLDAFGARYLKGYTGPSPAVGVCIAQCTPFAAGACAGGLECALALDIDGASAFGTCMPAGIDTAGDPCSLTQRCAAGLACVPGGTSLLCRQACKPGGTPACPAGQTCDTTVVQISGVGVCR